jgi:hypothetical protein
MLRQAVEKLRGNMVLERLNISSSNTSTDYLLITGLCTIEVLLMVCCILYKRVAI